MISSSPFLEIFLIPAIIFTTLLREMMFYGLMYSFYNLNINGIKILGPIFANLISYPLKFMIIKYSYPTLNMKYNIMIKSFIFEILESSIGDVIAINLIYQ